MAAYKADAVENIHTAGLQEDTGEEVFICAPSFAQQRLWFLNQLDPDSSAYNLSLTFRVRGPLDPATLEYALNAIVRRHETLRTTFEPVDGTLRQIIALSAAVSLPMTDLQAIPAGKREAVAEELLTAEVRRPFDLRTGPIFRAHLWRLAPEDFILMLNMHHIAGDGWSFGILRREMGAHYEACRMGRPADLPELPIQYADFARWQRDWLQGDTLEQQSAYWRERLGEQAPALMMPTDHPRPPVRSSQGAVQRILIPPAVCAGIKSLAEREGCTTYMTYLAAYKTLLHRFTGQTDIWIGSPAAGRVHQETENLIGCFVNTLVLRTDCSGQPTFQEFLHQVRDVSIGALSRQEMPFETLVDKLGVERDRSRNPLFQAMFIDSSTFIQPLELPTVTFSPLLIERGGAMLDLTLFLVGNPDGLKIGLEYSTDLFEHETATRLLHTYITLLESIVADPAQRLDSLLPDLNPSEFAASAESPQDTGGKVVRRDALPAPTQKRTANPTHDDAPCDAVQCQLKALWESVLRVQPVGVQDNFFDLGGHSLLAVQLFAAIEREFGKKLPLATLFHAPTIQQLAAHLRQPKKAENWSPLVAIQPHGSLTPFFCVHAVGANVLNYHLLSRYMGENQPFYGFQAQGLDGAQTPLGTVQDMAAQYIREMQKVQPHGPYVLGGGSSGGTVAFEMAQQLTAQGEPVALVALIDTVLMRQQMSNHSRSRPGLQWQARWFDLHLGKLLQLSFRDQIRYLAGAARSKTSAKFGLRVGSNQNDTKDTLTPETFVSLRKTILEAIRQYQPALYSGRVALFMASKSPYRTHDDPRLRWSEFADAGLELHQIPGDHDSILDEPHVVALAARLQSCLEHQPSPAE